MTKLKWQPIKVKLGQIRAWENNPRLSTKAQAERIIASEKKFGQAIPFLLSPVADGKYPLLDGHQRLSAWLTVYGEEYEMDANVSNRLLSDDEHKELIITLHTGATGDWDWNAISAWDTDKLKGWGMDEAQKKAWDNDSNNLKELLNAEEETVDAEPQIDRAAELLEKWQVKTGDLWQIGEHRLLCGDSTKREDVERVMGGERAAVCLTDPPYGLEAGKESGKNNYNEYKDTRENLEKLAAVWLPIAREISDVVVFSPGVTNAWIYPEANWIMCWFYGGGQLRSSWGFNCWQPFLCYGKDPSLAVGKGARPDAIDMNTPANAQDLDHPCPKPEKLWEWFIERLSFDRNDTFYDPFNGSGTTLVACQNLGRRGRGIEISPAYCAVTLERMATAFPELTIERLDT